MIILFTLVQNKMDTCADKKNPLVHDGTSQWSRYLDQLKPEHILVNEKTKAQWVAFTSAMANRLNYFNDQNIIDGDWSDFFNNQAIVNYAKLSLEDVDKTRKFIQTQISVLQAAATPPGDTDRQEAFSTLCSVVFTVCGFLEEQIQSTDKASKYNKRLSDLVSAKLKAPLKRFLTYYKGAINHGLTDNAISQGVKIFGKDLISLDTFLQSIDSPIWFDQSISTDFETYYNSLPEDISVFAQVPADISYVPGVSIPKCLARVSRHNLFTSVLDVFLYSCSYTKQLTAQAFDEELTSNQFPAHISLYLTFLQILREAQSDLNQFTGRHLDFFYERVLQLAPLAAVPNQAHLAIQLGKQVDEYSLPAGTLFKAGKDSLGKDASYTLKKDTVFNKAQVAALKNFYLAAAADNSVTPAVSNEKKAFASEITNSADGAGKPIKDVPAAWHPFGNKAVSTTGNVTMLMPTANVGFALASQFLYLQEGSRQIKIRLYTSDYSLLSNATFRCELTTAKAWTPLTNIKPVAINTGTGNCVEFSIALDTKFPAVVGYSANVHGGGIETDLPIIRFFLDDDDFTQPGKFGLLRFASFTKCSISVSVGSTVSNAASISPASFNGLKSLSLSNNLGVIDASKPFSPFGKPAQKDNFIIVGSRELFLKPGATYQVIVEHTELPKPGDDYVYPPLDFSGISSKNDFLAALAVAMPASSFEYLSNGTWSNTSSGFYDSSQFAFLANDSLPETLGLDFDQTYDVFNESASNGFLKVTLTKDFGADAYQDGLIQYRIDQSKGTSPLPPAPIKPYNPTIKTISINYTATTELEFGTDNSKSGNFITYYHLHPFGTKELTNVISDTSALLDGKKYQLNQLSRFQPLLTANKPVKVSWNLVNPFPKTVAIKQPVLPQFDGTVENVKMQFMSELYIGLIDLVPGETVNILFQVLDGSTNPLVSKPDKHVFWFYLSDNEWLALDKTKVRDSTAQLLNSGIISFDIPEDANNDNTLLPAGFIWLKAAIVEKPDAVCKLIDIIPQAALVEFLDNNNDPGFQNSQLAAGSIAKLVKPISAIKGIIQPYESFGGKAAENIDSFRVRVSERIRHKDRAIQIDDYEKIILQQFTGIQKVKCLNHTWFEPGVIYNEQAPGHVTIISIPYINKNNSTGILKPYTSTATLTAIKDFVGARISPHVNLHVENPLFEEILMDFNVSFIAGSDKVYYANLLRQDIMKYLSPWAYDDHAEISFGGRIYKSTIIDFIEDRPYVDFVTDVKMFHRPDGTSSLSKDSDTIIASTARSVLVSVPAESHNVNPL